jgi:hypothetical protein
LGSLAFLSPIIRGVQRRQPCLSDAPIRSEELFRRIDISPNDLFDRLGRDGIEIIVEGLIALLNHHDGDCEDEGAPGCDDREGDELQAEKVAQWRGRSAVGQIRCTGWRYSFGRYPSEGAKAPAPCVQ